MSSPVLVEISGGEQPLICFPPAGSGASYFRFIGGERAVHAIEYPGRETRYREPFATSRRDLVNEIVDALVRGPQLSGATLLGHSLGATLAFETAVELEARGVYPARVVLSARNSTSPGTSPVAPDGDCASDAELREWLLELGGTRPEVLDHPGLAKLIFNVCRADLQLGAQGGVAGQIAAPILALCGDRDPAATAAAMSGWAGRTTGSFTSVTLTGDHDALRINISHLLNLLKEQS